MQISFQNSKCSNVIFKLCQTFLSTFVTLRLLGSGHLLQVFCSQLFAKHSFASVYNFVFVVCSDISGIIKMYIPPCTWHLALVC